MRNETFPHSDYLLLSQENTYYSGEPSSVYVRAIAESLINHQNGTIMAKLMRKQDKFSHLATSQNDILIGFMPFCHDFPRLRLRR